MNLFFAIGITSDHSLDATGIYAIYKKRWRIEEYHKSIKSNASLEKSPTKTERSQNNHIFAVLFAYFKLECLKIKTHLNHFALKYKIFIHSTKSSMKKLHEITYQNSYL